MEFAFSPLSDNATSRKKFLRSLFVMLVINSA